MRQGANGRALQGSGELREGVSLRASPELLCIHPHLCLLLCTPHTWAHIVLNLIRLPFYHSTRGSILFARPLETWLGLCLRVLLHVRKGRTGLRRVTTEKLRSRRGVLFWIRASSSNSHHLSFCPESRCHELFGRWLYENVVFIGWAARAKFLLGVGSKESLGALF